MYILILALVLLAGLYNITLNIVELRSAGNPTPANVSDIYDGETYLKWKQYCAEHCRLRISFNVISTLVSLAILATKAYAAFASLFPDNIFVQLLAVVLLELIVSTIVDLPRAYIATMVIEQKYGFNRSNMKTFVIDQIRSLILGLVLSLALAGLIALCHIWFEDLMAVICGIALAALMLCISFLAPIFMRVGNKFIPLEEGELRDRLMALLTSHGYQVRAIEVMDASRRTTKMNAYFTGFGKMKTIVLYDNLVNAMTPDEICAVFAHELGHGLHKDTLKLQLVSTLNFAIIALLAWGAVSLTGIYTAFGFAGLNYGFAYILVGIALNIFQPFTGILTNAMSRSFEYAADRQAVKEGYGEAMIPALKKLAKDNFAHLSPAPLYVVLEYSHPPIDRRIAAIEKELVKN